MKARLVAAGLVSLAMAAIPAAPAIASPAAANAGANQAADHRPGRDYGNGRDDRYGRDHDRYGRHHNRDHGRYGRDHDRYGRHHDRYGRHHGRDHRRHGRDYRPYLDRHRGGNGRCYTNWRTRTAVNMWCDGRGPERYGVLVVCTHGRHVYQYTSREHPWYGDRRGATAVCRRGHVTTWRAYPV